MNTLFGVLVIVAGIAMMAAGLTSTSFAGKGIFALAPAQRRPPRWVGCLVFSLLGGSLTLSGTWILLKLYAVV